MDGSVHARFAPRKRASPAPRNTLAPSPALLYNRLRSDRSSGGRAAGKKGETPMTLLEQCQIWHKNDEYQKIIDTLEAIPA